MKSLEFKDNGDVVVNTKLVIRKSPKINGGRLIGGCHCAVDIFLRGSRTFEGSPSVTRSKLYLCVHFLPELKLIGERKPYSNPG